MHPNFYHWHSRAELNPETSVLQIRWDAAAKFGEKASSSDLAAIVQAALFPDPPPDLVSRLGSAVITADPTFPPQKNGELIRVMAAAAAYSIMETNSDRADAVAIGLHAGMFQNRSEPVCNEITERFPVYLATESERVRPSSYSAAMEKAEGKIQALLTSLKTAGETNNAGEVAKNIETLNRGIFAAIKESHDRLGSVVERMAEETQFLWWLVGRNSPLLNRPRGQIKAIVYSLASAVEAADRVHVLPPPGSAESLLEEVVRQSSNPDEAVPVSEIVQSSADEWQRAESVVQWPETITPVASLLAIYRQTKKIETAAIKKARLVKVKLFPVEVGKQYFRELMFARALSLIS